MSKFSKKNHRRRRSFKKTDFKKIVKDNFTVITATSAVLLVSAVTVIGVRAYLAAQTEDKTNKFFPMTYTNTEITETYTPATATADGNDTTRLYEVINEEITKTAQVHNLDGADKKPVYARVAIVPTVRLYQAGKLPENITSKVDFSYDIQAGTDWVKNGGYYYYKTMLMPGDSSTDVFKDGKLKITVKCEESLINAGDIKVDVAVIADTIQAVETDSANRDNWVYTADIANSTWGVSGIFTVPSNNSGS